MSERIKILGVGDIMLGEHPLALDRGVITNWLRMELNPFELISSYLSESQILTGNLECTLSSETELSGYRARTLRAPPRAAALLREVGFSAVSVANNHTMDHGPGAFKRTIRALQREGIAFCGTHHDPILFPIEDRFVSRQIVVALIGASFRPNETEYEPLYTIIETPKDFKLFCQSVESAKREADILIVHCHWGDEFVTIPSPHQIKFARELITNGADVIFGHHPHVYQGLQMFSNSPVFFSLGNFVSDMKQSYLRRSAVAVVEVDSQLQFQAKSKPIRINSHNCPFISNSISDHDFINIINHACSILAKGGMDSLYHFMLKRARMKYKRDLILDYIFGLGQNPHVRFEIGINSIRRIAAYLGRMTT
jgi:poly-gamma-glutamate synthesis protein (capsule biosynthesis protein)